MSRLHDRTQPKRWSTGEGTMSYAMAGRPGGRRVVWHHGLLGDVGIAPAWNEMATAAGIEVLTVARPGYGASTPITMASIAEWSRLVVPLLDHLGWVDVDAVGISAGSAYAYALAVSAPERVRRVGVCSGLPHVADRAILSHYSPEARARYEEFRTAPVTEVARQMTAFFEDLRSQLPEGHRWHPFIDASLSHDAAGPTREARLQIRPWGFELEDIRQPVHLWHAREDAMVPFAAAQATADKLDRGVLHVQAEPEHVSSDRTGEELFAYLSAP